METIKNYITKNYKTIISVLVGLFLLYWVIFILTPLNTMAISDSKKIDSLDNVVNEMYKEQDKLENKITDINKEIDKIEDNVTKIKKNKTKVANKYHEEIIRVDEYTEPELDSFFSNRYK